MPIVVQHALSIGNYRYDYYERPMERPYEVPPIYLLYRRLPSHFRLCYTQLMVLLLLPNGHPKIIRNQRAHYSTYILFPRQGTAVLYPRISAVMPDMGVTQLPALLTTAA